MEHEVNGHIVSAISKKKEDKEWGQAVKLQGTP